MSAIEGRRDLKSLLVWSFFSLAVLRMLWVFEFLTWLNFAIYPGAVFSLYLLYYGIKHGRLLSYRNYLIAILSMSTIYHLAEPLLHIYLGKLGLINPVRYYTTSFVLSLLMASAIYFIVSVIRKVSGK